MDAARGFFVANLITDVGAVGATLFGALMPTTGKHLFAALCAVDWKRCG
jgi:hypothetical protein